MRTSTEPNDPTPYELARAGGLKPRQQSLVERAYFLMVDVFTSDPQDTLTRQARVIEKYSPLPLQV